VFTSKGGSRAFYWGTSGPLGSALSKDFPEIEATVRIWPWSVKVERQNQNRLVRTRLHLVDKNVFDFEFVKGNPQTAFEDPSGMVISERVADLLFGEEDPIGKILTVDCCLGLFGLAAFSAQRRTKEIGIRKVLGASVGQVVMMFYPEFIKIVAFASLVAWPLAYYVLVDWLADFSYRIDLSISVFILSTLLAIGVALITVSYQAWKAAQINPVDALKYE
jgi:hypothetical protein